MPLFVKLSFIAVTTQIWKLQFGLPLELPELATNLKTNAAFPCTEAYPAMYLLYIWVTYKISPIFKIDTEGSTSFFFFSESTAIKTTMLLIGQIHIKDEKDTLPELEKI